jgi:hypothetical protein
VVPFNHAFHEADALALDRVGDNEHGLSLRGGFCQSHGEIGVVVPIDFAHVPAERTPLVGHRCGTHHVLRAAGDLERIVIEDGDEIVELIVRGGHAGFPVGAFR